MKGGDTMTADMMVMILFLVLLQGIADMSQN